MKRDFGYYFTIFIYLGIGLAGIFLLLIPLLVFLGESKMRSQYGVSTKANYGIAFLLMVPGYYLVKYSLKELRIRLGLLSSDIKVSQNGHARKFKLIHSPPDSSEGYFFYWPQRGEEEELRKEDWLSAFDTDNLSIKLYLIGSLYKHRGEIDMIGLEVQSIIESNEILLQSLLIKYFDEYEEGLRIKEGGLFLDLVNGLYSENGTINEVPIASVEHYVKDYNKAFADGTEIRILNKEFTWTDLEKETFIASDHFDEFVKDLTSFEQLLK